MTMKTFSAFITTVLFCLTTFGETPSPSAAGLKPAGILGNNMLLQRDQNIPIWGWAEPGAEVTVSFAGQTMSSTADVDGKWQVILEPMPASAEPRDMMIQSSFGNQHLALTHILVGDVWFASGQSNMQFQLKEARGGKQDAAAADYPLIRLFQTERTTSREVKQDFTGAWNVCSPDTAGSFSAVAYYFGRTVHRETGVPIGLIESTWGGSPIEAWSPMKSLNPFPAAMKHKAEMDKAAETFDEEAADKHNKQIWENYNRGVEKAKTEGTAWPSWPNEKTHPHKSHRYPANLYNTMIHPLIPYSIRGAVWYQGENNGQTIERALEYRGLLETMITSWRERWQNDFPFYAVQLVNFQAPQSAPVEDTPWPYVRESILKTAEEVPGVGMAIGIDVGEAGDIHPKNKRDIGLRLAQQALAETYGKPVVPGGPIYRSMKKQGDRIILRFDDIGSGLVAKGGPLRRFAIAGKDKPFVEADAFIEGDTVVVRSDEVPHPAAVRYAWAQNPQGCNLFNKEGFPASPFRTDNRLPEPQGSGRNTQHSFYFRNITP